MSSSEHSYRATQPAPASLPALSIHGVVFIIIYFLKNRFFNYCSNREPPLSLSRALVFYQLSYCWVPLFSSESVISLASCFVLFFERSTRRKVGRDASKTGGNGVKTRSVSMLAAEEKKTTVLRVGEKDDDEKLLDMKKKRISTNHIHL